MSIVLICFLIGVKLHDKWVGLLAAFLYGMAVFSIQMAHFGTADCDQQPVRGADDPIGGAGTARWQAD